MPRITPTKSVIKTAERTFTDRVDYIEAFWSAYNSITNEDNSVLVYYGVGGIGKTRLRKELELQLKQNDKGAIYASIDFESESNRLPINALLQLRRQLGTCKGIKFTLFDFLYITYLKKGRPEVPISRESIPFIEEGDTLYEIISNLTDIPYAGFISKSLSFVKKLYSSYQEKIIENKINEITRISELEIYELENLLPEIFAKDLNEYILSLESYKPIVIFLDTYEALWTTWGGRGSYNSCDEWIREYLIPNTSGVLFTIYGREKIRWVEENSAWEKCLDQHLIGELSKEDAKGFLMNCDIKEDAVINNILENFEGVPYYLDLAVDFYNEMKKNGMLALDSFRFDRKHDLFKRFIKYLGIPEQHTLFILSHSRFWDESIFDLVIEHFQTGLTKSSLMEFCRFSFITRNPDNTWHMHALMRESLRNNYDLRWKSTDIHTLLATYYCEAFTGKELSNTKEKNMKYAFEAVYHYKKCCETEQNYLELYKWYTNNFNKFPRYLVVDITLDLVKFFAESNYGQKTQELSSSILINMLDKAIFIPRYKGSDTLSNFYKIYNVALDTFGKYSKEVIKVLNRNIDNYTMLYDQEGILRCNLAITHISEKLDGAESEEYIRHLYDLGEAYYWSTRYSLAEETAKKLINLTKKVLGKDHRLYKKSLYLLARAYNSPDIHNIIKSELIYRHILSAIGESDSREDQYLYIEIMDKLALNRQYDRNYLEQLSVLVELLNYKKKHFGIKDQYVTTLIDMAIAYHDLGNADKALELCLYAQSINEFEIGKESTLNWLLGKLYDEKGMKAQGDYFISKFKRMKDFSNNVDRSIIENLIKGSSK